MFHLTSSTTEQGVTNGAVESSEHRHQQRHISKWAHRLPEKQGRITNDQNMVNLEAEFRKLCPCKQEFQKKY